MKVICVVDSAKELNKKIDLIKTNYGSNICFVVKAPLESIFKTFGYTLHAVYTENLAKIIHTLLLGSSADDVLVVYTSLSLNQALLNKFNAKIGARDAVVSLMPKYNAIERMHNGAYNLYVKSIFKLKDSMASPKLQFLPTLCVAELLSTHFGNKLFEVNPKLSRTVEIEDKEVNKSAKIHAPITKIALISIIVALVITAVLIITLALTKMHAMMIVLFVCLYLLDIFISLLFQYKSYFDHRFLK